MSKLKLLAVISLSLFPLACNGKKSDKKEDAAAPSVTDDIPNSLAMGDLVKKWEDASNLIKDNSISLNLFAAYSGTMSLLEPVPQAAACAESMAMYSFVPNLPEGVAAYTCVAYPACKMIIAEHESRYSFSTDSEELINSIFSMEGIKVLGLSSACPAPESYQTNINKSLANVGDQPTPIVFKSLTDEAIAALENPTRPGQQGGEIEEEDEEEIAFKFIVGTGEALINFFENYSQKIEVAGAETEAGCLKAFDLFSAIFSNLKVDLKNVGPVVADIDNLARLQPGTRVLKPKKHEGADWAVNYQFEVEDIINGPSQQYVRSKGNEEKIAAQFGGTKSSDGNNTKFEESLIVDFKLSRTYWYIGEEQASDKFAATLIFDTSTTPSLTGDIAWVGQDEGKPMKGTNTWSITRKSENEIQYKDKSDFTGQKSAKIDITFVRDAGTCTIK